MTSKQNTVRATHVILPVHFPTRVQQMAAEVASVSVEDWPVGDDFLLREAVEAGAALASIARGILPFSRAYSLADVEIRWRCVPVSTPTRPHPGTLATRDPARAAPAARVIHLGDATGYPRAGAMRKPAAKPARDAAGRRVNPRRRQPAVPVFFPP